MKPEVQSKLRSYLLGQADEAELEAIEAAILTDDESFEELLIVEDEVIDDYLNETLSPEARAHFENNFLNSPERLEQLQFARVFGRYVSSQIDRSTPFSKPSPWGTWIHGFYSSPIRVAVSAVVLLAVALGVWQAFFRESDVEKGLLALNAAYRQQRPIEARISNLDYAPFVATRGPGTEQVDQNQLRRAELTLLEALQKKPSGQVQHALGKVYLAKKEFDKAIEQFDASLKIDPNNAQLYADLGAAWLEKGKLDRDGGDPGKGMEELGRALENINKALGLNPNLLEARFNRALCEEQLTTSAAAENDWREYLKRDSTSSWAEEARRRLQLLEEKKKSEAQTKEELIQSFLLAYEHGNDEAAWSALSLSRGRTGNLIVESLLDDYFHLESQEQNDEGDVMLKKLSYAGEVERTKVGDVFTRDLVHTLRSASAGQRERIAEGRQLIKEAIGRYNESELNEAIEILSAADKKFLGSGDECSHMFVQAWIGYCYLRLQQSEKALHVFQHLSQLFATKNYKSLRAQSLLAQADALNSKNEFSTVLERAGESFALSRQIEDRANSVRCLQAMTTVNLILGDYSESLRAAFRGLRLTEELPPDPKISWPFYHEASLDLYLLGSPTSALLFESEALRLATSNNLPLQASRSYDRLALIQEHLGNYGEAMRNSEFARAQGLQINDERMRTNVLAHAAMNLGRLFRETGEPRRAVDSFDTSLALYKQLDMNVYQYQAHKGKMLALMQLNDNNAAQAELDLMLYWFERNREKIAEERLRDKFFDVEQDTYDLAIDFTYSRKKDEAKALDLVEASRARSLNDLMSKGAQLLGDGQNPELTLTSGTPPLKVGDIQQSLPEHTQLIEYSVLSDKTIIWVITRDSISSSTSRIEREVLNEKTQQYLEFLSRGSPAEAEVNRLAEELYSALIVPVESDLNKNLQLCIIPDDKLSFVPFASLLSRNTGRHLIEDYTLQVAPSATIFITSTQNAKLRQSPGSERLLVVGNPRFDRKQFTDLSDLPSAKREAEEIAKTYVATPLTGDSAVASRIKPALTTADVIHFATHAVGGNQSPLLSKLLLAVDGNEMHHASSAYITAADIYRMKLSRTRLVVLSACQTGIERAYRGEGAIGLARPFIASGVPLVVASLWPVESEATANLMISFHKHRKQDHVSTVEALRRAQLEALHNPQLNSQFNWAAFVVIGGDAAF